MKTKKFDLVVGIPSYNEADSISFVVEQASKGLKKYFPDVDSIIVNVDNHSEDGTKNAFLNSKSDIPLKYISTPRGVTGKGNNFRNLFKFIIKSDAKAAIVVDSDLKSITPEWIEKLGSPLFKGYDYVIPIYTRHKYDATITNNLCYPLLYGLVCKNIRQPIAGDFAFSRNICESYLKKKWNNTTYHYGIDIFMTLTAVFDNFKITQVCLGDKSHKPSAPKLGRMFIEVINTLFSEILKNKPKWKDANSMENLGLTGGEQLGKGQDLSVDASIIKQTALAEYQQHRKNIRKFLTPEIFAKIDSIFSKEEINISSELWAKAVYDLLYSYGLNKKYLAVVRAMKSLYFGRFYTFMQLSKDWDNLQAEEKFRKQAQVFKTLKPYLLDKFKK
ncbi:MAG: glycosyltransferase [Nanoarchaeota archaeon]|nr:glycosyltransferase [Nanoarchaeota archaeon]